jgi:hypothetical protein
MLRTSLQATEHDDDALVSLSASQTLAQIVRKADFLFDREAVSSTVKYIPDANKFAVEKIAQMSMRDTSHL